MFFTTELSAQRSRDLNFSDIRTNAKPKVGAEQIWVTSNWKGKKIPLFWKDSLFLHFYSFCAVYIYVSNNR